MRPLPLGGFWRLLGVHHLGAGGGVLPFSTTRRWPPKTSGPSTLLEALPEDEYVRTNGLDDGRRLIGHFRGRETGPCEMYLYTAASPLRAQVLYLTEAVVEKKIPALQHTHEIATLSHTHSNSAGGTTEGLTERYPTEEALSQIACLENGKALPVEDGYILLNRALAVGDKVLLLRVQNGQKFIVLSRVF